jgi:ribonuclease HI
MKQKFYVVWNGLNPGIYDTWEACKLQVIGYENAQYQSFETNEAANEAYKKGYAGYRLTAPKKPPVLSESKPAGTYIQESIAVDAACRGNPGDMEYRGILVKTGKELFRIGPMAQGTNNIGEFLAIVHALAYMKREGMHLPVYSDSNNAIQWIRKKQCKTRLVQTPVNVPVFDLIGRAEKWLNENTDLNPVLKWNTAVWGEIPADFGRK